MNKINFFYVADRNGTPMTAADSTDIPNSVAQLTLIAGLILDGLPSQYQIQVSVLGVIIIEKQPFPKKQTIAELGIDGLINMNVQTVLTINDVKSKQFSTFVFELFKNDVVVSSAETILYFV